MGIWDSWESEHVGLTTLVQSPDVITLDTTYTVDPTIRSCFSTLVPRVSSIR